MPTSARGEIRDDISPEDLLRALVGMSYMQDQRGWQASVLRLVDVFVDGLRTRRHTRGSKTSRRKSISAAPTRRPRADQERADQ
jgi:hypothetical protein